MEEEKKNVTEDLKDETKEAFNKVKSEMKDADLKNETYQATNFVKEMFMNPIEAVKSTAKENGPKLATVLLIVAALIIVNVAYEIVFLVKYSYSFGSSIWSIVQAIIEPVLLILVPAFIVFLYNKNKKSLITTVSTFVVARVPVIFSTVVSLLSMIISQLSFVTVPVNAGLSVLKTILVYFGMKELLEENDESFVLTFVVIEVVTSLVMYVLRAIGVC